MNRKGWEAGRAKIGRDGHMTKMSRAEGVSANSVTESGKRKREKQPQSWQLWTRQSNVSGMTEAQARLRDQQEGADPSSVRILYSVTRPSREQQRAKSCVALSCQTPSYLTYHTRTNVLIS